MLNIVASLSFVVLTAGSLLYCFALHGITANMAETRRETYRHMAESMVMPSKYAPTRGSLWAHRIGLPLLFLGALGFAMAAGYPVFEGM